MKVLSENKKVRFDYKILESFEAGVVLIGQEVKSIKLGRISLKGAYVVMRNNELFLIGASVPAYQPKNASKDYDEQRSRKLLLTKPEIKTLIGKSKVKGLTLVPIKVYTKGGKIKVEFAVVKGRKKQDKRELIKKRDFKRERDRLLREKS